MRLRDSLYAGLYYAGGEGTPAPLVLQRNEVGSRWHSQFPQYGATLTVSELPDMDEIADRLTSGRDGPVLLRSIIHQDEPPDDSED